MSDLPDLVDVPLALPPATARWLVRLAADPPAVGGPTPDARPRAGVGSVEGMPVGRAGGVAVLPLYGVVVQRPGFLTRVGYATSAEQFAAAHAALVADASVRAVVWDVDSPGGSVAGVPEAAARLLALRGNKRTVALSNTLMASAAYWLASAADEVVSAPSASIGVVAVHEDRSAANDRAGVRVSYLHAGRYKVEGNPDQPLGGDARAALQQTIDDYYGQFVRHVAKARGTTEAAVRSGFGEGRVLTARRAVSARLADRTATLADVITKLSGGTGKTPAAGTTLRMYRALARQRAAEAE